MSSIYLKPITRENWEECAELKGADGQEEFLPSNLRSIALAQFYPNAVALAIYDGDDRMVDFTLYGLEEATQRWKIFRLMIAAEHQRRGHGRAAMLQVIQRLRTLPTCHEVFISYHTANHAARCLYRSLGFVDQELSGTKVTARLAICR
jgi:diamine N-acetyltransferase